MPTELWDREQIREFLGMKSTGSATIRRVRSEQPGKGNRRETS